jgi:LmbE family N-acetylglucosaminyl deacetylase
MATEPLTMLCVHAHPDDEALFTAGIQAHYARRGVRQILITCTVGDLGFDPNGRGFEDEGFDVEAVRETRAAELAESCALLSIDRAIQLGYHDSGMAGWPTNERPIAFINQDRAEVARRILEVIEQERPQVVVTYAADGFYGHPDHIATHLATMEAVSAATCVQKVYFVALAKTELSGFIELAKAAGMVLPEWLESGLVVGIDDELVQTAVDCSDVVELKHRALAAHRSQFDNADLVDMPDELFDAVFSVESYVRGLDTTGSALPETDLFVGIDR